jgi:hypothetical protein
MEHDTLITMLRRHSSKDSILETDLLVEDLGIDGDDADELYFDLLDNHGIDLNTQENIGQYFHSEGELIDVFFLFKWLAYKLRLHSKPAIRTLLPLSVSELLVIVQKCENA